ncbi:MAG: oligosaccharide flippase family protein [Dehalococcoidia bacterium]|nr:oligosaccharide flippase family protein [Dehalococcoidia bacterium]
MRRASSGVAWGQAGRITEVALGLAFSVLVVRKLGDQAYGTYALLYSLIGVTSVLCSLGLNEAVSKYLPIVATQGEEGQVGYLVRATVAYRLLFTLVGSIVLYLSCGFLAGVFQNTAISDLAFLIVAVFALQNTTDLLASFYVSYLRVKTYYLVRLVNQSLSLVLVLILFSLWGPSVFLVLTTVLLTTAVAGCLYLLGARTALRREPVEIDLAPVRRFALYIWLINLVTFGLGSQIDTLLVAYFLKDAAQIAYYNVAMMIVTRLYTVLTGWTIVLVPSLSEAFAKGGKEGLARASDLCFKLHVGVMLPALAFVGLRSDGLINLVFGTSYHPSSILLTVFALLTIGGAYALSGPVLNVLYVTGGEKIVVWLRVVTGSLNILLDILLIPPLGAMGAILATGISVLVTGISELFMARRQASIKYPVVFVSKITVATALAILAIAWVAATDWSMMLVSGALYSIVLVVALLVLKPLATQDKELATLASKYVGALVRYF